MSVTLTLWAWGGRSLSVDQLQTTGVFAFLTICLILKVVLTFYNFSGKNHNIVWNTYNTLSMGLTYYVVR